MYPKLLSTKALAGEEMGAGEEEEAWREAWREGGRGGWKAGGRR